MSVKTPKSLRAYYDSERFEKEYLYDGPLGPDYSRDGTRLRLWAPTAEQVLVNLYRQGDRGFCIGSLAMERREHGCWTLYLPRGPARDVLYLFGAGERSGAGDGGPYARAAGVNGSRSMIVDLRRTDPSGLAVRPPTRHPPGPAGDLGGQRPRLLLGPGGRLYTALAGQIPGLHPGGHHPVGGTASIPPA